MECMWHIYDFPMQGKSHTIYRMTIHLEDRQKVYFADGEEMDALEAATEKETTLTAFFELNQKDARARQYTYDQIAYHYVFGKGVWTPRQRRHNETLARIYAVSPKNKELFHLRILLINVPGNYINFK